MGMLGHAGADYARRNDLLAAQARAVQIDKVLDDATVQILRLTSPFMCVARADADERRGIPAYDTVSLDAGVQAPRALLVTCEGCGNRAFALHDRQRFCTRTCQQRAASQRHRDRVRARARAAAAA